MPRRGENIYKRKDGRWEGRVLRGHTPERKPRYRYIYGHTYKEVKQKMDIARTMTANQLHKPTCPEECMNCADVARRWLESKRTKVKESTFFHYENLLEGHIVPKIGTLAVQELNDILLNQFVDNLLHQGRRDRNGGLSAKTVSDILIILKAILKYARKMGYEVNVCLEELQVRKQHREMRVLTIEEQNCLAALFEAPSDRRCVGVMISLYTGLRLGEVCALKWESVNLAKQTIYVKATMQRVKNNTGSGNKTRVIITEPKSDCSIREIPIPQFLLPILNKFQAAENAFVLTGREDKYVEPRSMENYFQRCLKHCGIAPANYHALRHSFATRCVEMGFDIKSLSEILGHSNVSITLDRYVHSSFEQKRKNMDRLTMRFCA